VYRKEKCKEILKEINTPECGITMEQAPPGSGKTQLAYDILRYCEEDSSEDIACIYIDAKNNFDFERLTLASDRYTKNPKAIKGKLVILVDEIQSRYATRVKEKTKSIHTSLLIFLQLQTGEPDHQFFGIAKGLSNGPLKLICFGLYKTLDSKNQLSGMAGVT